MCGTWWQERTDKEKKIVVILSIALFIVMVIVITVFVQGSEETLLFSCNRRCKVIVKSLRRTMDTSVDPCEDFYQFSCGNWETLVEEKQEIYSAAQLLQHDVLSALLEAVEKKMTKSNLSPAEEKMINVYKSCLNSNFDEIVSRSLLEEVAGFPICDQNWKDTPYDINVGIANAYRKFGVSSLVQFSVIPNWKNTTRNIITLSAPQGNRFEMFSSRIANLFSSLGEMFPSYCLRRYLKFGLVIAMLDGSLRAFYTESAKIPPLLNNKIYKLSELNSEFPGTVDFGKIVQLITYDSFYSISNETMNDYDVAITDYHYIKKLTELVDSDFDTQGAFATYIGVQVLISHFEPDVIKRLRKINNSNDTKMIPVPQKEVFCLKTVSSGLYYVMDKVYIDKIGASSRSNRKELEMIDHISHAFEILATESNWLDSKTISGVKEKLHTMKKAVGYPSWILSDEKLDRYYKSLLKTDSCFTTNTKRVVQFTIENALSQLHRTNDLEKVIDFPGSTTTVNAFYNLLFNTIYFPIGIQGVPFYYKDMPWYLNFGAIGSVIGHEITHGFDGTGMFLDENGNVRDWWSSEAKKAFEQKTECFIAQYKSYFDDETETKVKGTKTLSEDIADNGGIRQAYLAYQNWVKKHGKEPALPGLEEYTPNQLFYIAFGNMWCAHFDNDTTKQLIKEDKHSQVPYRVWGPVSNSKEFAKAFNCKKGSKMNPENKCVIW